MPNDYCSVLEEFTLIFTDSPKDLTPAPEKMVYASLGDSLNISATIQACPKPSSIQWRKISDSNIDILGFKKYTIDLGNDIQLYYITIEKVLHDHYGVYECETQNEIGQHLVLQYDMKQKGKKMNLISKLSKAM